MLTIINLTWMEDLISTSPCQKPSCSQLPSPYPEKERNDQQFSEVYVLMKYYVLHGNVINMSPSRSLFIYMYEKKNY